MEDMKATQFYAAEPGSPTWQPYVTDGETDEKLGTEYDMRAMVRMGKKQELRREFQFLSIWGYAVILGCSWEFALVDGVLSLPNGGTAGTVWIFLVACFGMFFVTVSMAEMASMAPTAGGQYHWCSEFAPRSMQRFLSYCVGFLCVLGWQTSLVAASYAAAQQLQAIIVISDETYVSHTWHTALLTWGVLFVAIFANTIAFRKLPLIEGIIMFLHIFGFFAFVVVLWVMAPRSDTSVLATFEDNGWGSTGLACLVGINAAVGDIIGADSSVHLSEELREASWVLPRSMIATAGMNYALGFVMIVTLVFCLGDYDDAISSPTGQPYVYMVQNATGSKAATIVLTLVMFLLLTACAVNNVTTSSRQLWSFARDGGLPFSRWLSRVRPGWDIPVNAVFVSACITVILTCIVIGSSTAYAVLLTLVISGLLSSYIICISCALWKRLAKQPFPPSRFSLGKAGNIINIVALAFLILAWLFQFFPSAPNPTAESMNWCVLIYGAVIIFFSIYYVARARHRYEGPVAMVRKDL
ncbi:amino acid transporter [Teratosphaeria nubilosa]|uniref:Amino acid transporter n=1 Tax=Teratosphaeria nubilosa TaxID=161662 RepID=A0A6G1L605_9PEZI|nr:amino acid transporter [Teratosphaeria nubilosa]